MPARSACSLLWVAFLSLILALPAVAGTAADLPLAPDFSLPGRDRTISLHAHRGQVVVLDFWASWCAPCRRSFPWLGSLQERYGARGLAVVAVNLDKDRAPADEFLRRHPAPFTVAFDPSGATADAFRVRGMPATFVIGPDGRVLGSHTGFEKKAVAAAETLIVEALPR